MPLTPSDRIKLISNIASKLGQENWSIVDLTLSQFSLPTTNEWSGEREQYVVEMLVHAKDEQLVSLGAHVGYDQKVEDSGIEPPFWRPGTLKVFLSHLATNREVAAQLQQELKKYGISSFVAHNDIEPTAEWQTQIETALGTCDSLIALLHPDFHKSKWTDQEIGYVMGRGLPVFSVRYGETPQGFIGKFQAFNGNNKDIKILAEEIFDAYLKHRETKEKMAHVIIGIFEQSINFDHANRLMGYLQRLEWWDPSFKQRILDARKTNTEVRGAWNVSDTNLEALFDKWKS